MKNVRKALLLAAIASTLTLGFSPVQANALPQNVDTQISSTLAAYHSPAFFSWFCKPAVCN